MSTPRQAGPAVDTQGPRGAGRSPDSQRVRGSVMGEGCAKEARSPTAQAGTSPEGTTGEFLSCCLLCVYCSGTDRFYNNRKKQHPSFKEKHSILIGTKKMSPWGKLYSEGRQECRDG